MINYKGICKKIGYDDPGYIESYPLEAIECASHNGDLVDFDWMAYLKYLIGIPISYGLYRHIDTHYDGSIMELDEFDLPQLHWLINDYATNGNLTEDIWKDYDFAAHKDKYGCCGWHERVMKETKGA